MHRTSIPHDQQRYAQESVARRLIQQLCTWTILAILLIVVFSLLGARIVELYHQFAGGAAL